MSDGYVMLGYTLYLAAVLVPGYGLGEFFGRWQKEDGLMLRLGLSLGYGVAVDTVVFALATLGVRGGTLKLAGVGPGLVYFTIALGALLLTVSFLRRKRLEGIPKVSVSELGVLLCSGIVGVIVLLYFQRYPIFPTFYNPDFIAVVKQSTRLIDGSLVSIPGMLLYGAGIYQVAAAFLAVGTPDLPTAQASMAILVVLSPLLVYGVAFRLFGNGRAALLSAIIYSLSGTIWAQMVYSDGLYPNFVGVLLEFTLLVAFLDFSSNFRSPEAWVSSGVVLFASYFSHYTVLATFGSFALLALVFLVLRRPRLRGVLVATAVFLGPAVAGFVLFRGTILTDLSISYQSGAQQPLTTQLSNALSFAPSLAYLAFDIRNDFGFAAMMLVLAAAFYKGLKSGDASIALPAVWFVGLLVAAPQDYAAWRFALAAVLPLTLLAGYGLDSMMPHRRLAKIKRLKSADSSKFFTVLVGILILTPIVATGWASSFTQTLIPNAATGAESQGHELDAMNWLKQNTPNSSKIISVTDPIFLYTDLYVGRNCSYGYGPNETQTISYAQQHGFGYVVVTRLNVYFNLLTPAADDSAGSLPWFTYVPNSNATLAYTNPDVKIFQVHGGM